MFSNFEVAGETHGTDAAPRETTMCDRLSLERSPWRAIATLWLTPQEREDHHLIDNVTQALDETHPFNARHNITPEQDVWCVRSGVSLGERAEPRDNYQIEALRWGLVPAWAQGPRVGARQARVKAEVLHHVMASAARPLGAQRALVLASAFYRCPALEAPTRFADPAHPTLTLAAIWDTWVSPRGELVTSCALVTAPGEEGERWPVALEAEQRAAWLDPSADLGALTAMLRAQPERWRAQQVAPLVRDPEPVSACAQPRQLDLFAAQAKAQRARLEDHATQIALPFLSAG